MSKIITIRPQPGAASTLKEAQNRGLDALAYPLSKIAPCSWEGPDLADIDALLVASGNAIRHGGLELERYKSKPVFAVGARSAEIAQAAGFIVQDVGSGGLQKLLGLIEQRPVRLLRLAAARQVEIVVPEGMSIETRVLYEPVDLPMPKDMAEALTQDAIVLLHSAGAAEHFRKECDRLGAPIAKIRIAALGPRIAAAAGTGWAEVRYAPQPADGALLALAEQMCH